MSVNRGVGHGFSLGVNHGVINVFRHSDTHDSVMGSLMGHGVSLGIGRGINHAAVHGVGHQVMIMAKETSSNQFPH